MVQIAVPAGVQPGTIMQVQVPAQQPVVVMGTVQGASALSSQGPLQGPPGTTPGGSYFHLQYFGVMSCLITCFIIP